MSDENPLDTRVHAAKQKVYEIKRRRRRRSVLIRLLLLVALVGAGIAAYLYLIDSSGRRVEREAETPPPAATTREMPPEPTTAPPVAVEPAAPGPVPEVEEEEVFELPSLQASDPLVRELGGDLSTRAELDDWLLADDLIWRFTISVVNVAEGTSPRHQLLVLAPRSEFKAQVTEGRITTDPASFARYDTFVDVFTSLHSRATVRLYERLRPLIDEAYADLGFPDESFDATLTRAIHELLLAPQVQGEAELVPGVVSYEYRDPRLEALSPAQKQLLRMGPRNVARVQNKIRELALEMGISSAELPQPVVYTASD